MSDLFVKSWLFQKFWKVRVNRFFFFYFGRSDLQLNINNIILDQLVESHHLGCLLVFLRFKLNLFDELSIILSQTLLIALTFLQLHFLLASFVLDSLPLLLETVFGLFALLIDSQSFLRLPFLFFS